LRYKTVVSLIIFSFFTSFFGANINAENSNDLVSKDTIATPDVNYLRKLPELDYILGSGDQLLIIVSKEYPELTRNITINGEGIINIPTLGRLYVNGLNVSELKVLLDNEYKKYVKYTDVQVNIINYRPIKVLVDGEVNEPGLFVFKGSLIAPVAAVSPIQPTLPSSIPSPGDFSPNVDFSNFLFPSVFDAIQKSGGITEYSDLKNIQLIRKNTITNGGGKITTTLNLEKLILNRDDSHNIRIYDGDTIVVGKLKNSNQNNISSAVKFRMNPKYVKVIVGGRVNSPGVLTLTRFSTLNDAIDMAGGTKLIRGGIRYISFKNDGTLDKRKISYSKKNKSGSYSNPYLKQGDLIAVGNNVFSISAEAISEITAPFQGLYSTYSLYELITE
tara:strand:+ start:433 stop:1596 length:1164 start_codon:yes stop_codon:yes gene_type:complete